MRDKKDPTRVLQCMLALLCAVVLSIGVIPSAGAASLSELQKKASTLEQQKKDVQAKLGGLKNDHEQAVEKKKLLDNNIDILNSQIANAQAQIELYEGKIAETQAQLEEAEAKEAEQYDLFCRRVRVMEENGKISYWSVLFRAESFTDLLSLLDCVNEVMESDQRVIDDLEALQAEITIKKDDLEEQKAQSEQAKARLADKKAELKTQRQKAEQLIREIEANQSTYAATLAQIKRDKANVEAEAARLTAQASGTATKGGYIWPETKSRRITSPFGPRKSPGGIGSRNHGGVDIGGVFYSTSIIAAKAGKVVISRYSSSYGNYVMVSHGPGNATVYAHLSSRCVKVGDYVKQGQKLGISGSTGHSTGPHLHFEIRENNKRVNPLKYLTNYIRAW